MTYICLRWLNSTVSNVIYFNKASGQKLSKALINFKNLTHPILSGPQLVHRSATKLFHVFLSSVLLFISSSCRFFLLTSRVRVRRQVSFGLPTLLLLYGLQLRACLGILSSGISRTSAGSSALSWSFQLRFIGPFSASALPHSLGHTISVLWFLLGSCFQTYADFLQFPATPSRIHRHTVAQRWEYRWGASNLSPGISYILSKLFSGSRTCMTISLFVCFFTGITSLSWYTKLLTYLRLVLPMLTL